MTLIWVPGTAKKMVVPTPGLNSAQILPPRFSTTFATMARPIPVPLVLTLADQLLEHPKCLLGILLLEADPVVGDHEQPTRIVPLRGDMQRKGFLTPVLDRVGNEVLERLTTA